MPNATDQAKDVAAKLAKEAIKKAAMQAAASTATAVAPYVGIGCLVIVGLILLIFLFSALTILTLYGLCTYAPHTTGWVTWWYNMGDLCKTFNF